MRQALQLVPAADFPFHASARRLADIDWAELFHAKLRVSKFTNKKTENLRLKWAIPLYDISNNIIFKGDRPMPSLTQPLRDEHKELYLQVEGLRLAGDAVNESLTSSAHDRIEESYHFLIHDLIPHALAEEKALYPMVQKAMHSPHATATMMRDHQQVKQLTEELESLRVHRSQLSITTLQAQAMRRVLYGLYTLVKVHFAKEEEIYLPILDEKLTADEAEQMFKDMKAVARQAKAAVPR
jgi:iron-sulfur cluster repair protein YtfE (RIC family)